MGIRPEVWGPVLWGAIHLTCLTGTATPEFINSFADALPCPACSAHFKELLMELPFPDSNDPMILFQWSVNVHNSVNARIGKPIITMEQALQRWTAVPKTEPHQFDYKIPFMIVLFIIFFFAVSKLL